MSRTPRCEWDERLGRLTQVAESSLLRSEVEAVITIGFWRSYKDGTEKAL